MNGARDENLDWISERVHYLRAEADMLCNLGFSDLNSLTKPINIDQLRDALAMSIEAVDAWGAAARELADELGGVTA